MHVRLLRNGLTDLVQVGEAVLSIRLQLRKLFLLFGGRCAGLLSFTRAFRKIGAKVFLSGVDRNLRVVAFFRIWCFVLLIGQRVKLTVLIAFGLFGHFHLSGLGSSRLCLLSSSNADVWPGLHLRPS